MGSLFEWLHYQCLIHLTILLICRLEDDKCFATIYNSHGRHPRLISPDLDLNPSIKNNFYSIRRHEPDIGILQASILEEQKNLLRDCDSFIRLESSMENDGKLSLEYSTDFPFRIPAICWLLEVFLPTPREPTNSFIDNPKINNISDSCQEDNQLEIGFNLIYEDKEKLGRVINNDQETRGSPLVSKILTKLVSANVDWNKDLLADGEKLDASELSPVILIPGLMGSRLQDKLDKESGVHWFCQLESDWQDGFWLEVDNLLPLISDCWLDNMRLEYDSETGFAKCPLGVQVRAYPFGSVESVECLDSIFVSLSGYMSEIVAKLVSLGYQRDVNLVAGPYDFRLAPQQLGEYFDQLTRLIESTQNGPGYGNQVTLVCHSMGCNHMLLYLRQKSAQWRKKHILKLIAISAPWGGSVQALQEILVGGATKMIPFVTETRLRDLFRTFPSSAYLLPNPSVFGGPQVPSDEAQEPLVVVTNERNYTITQVEQVLRDLGLDHEADWYRRLVPQMKPLEEPPEDIKVICVHGINVETTRQIIFSDSTQFHEGEYQLFTSDGDGTVNWESLSVCKQWAQQHPDRIENIEIFNSDHIGALFHGSLLEIIEKEVLLSRDQLLNSRL